MSHHTHASSVKHRHIGVANDHERPGEGGSKIWSMELDRLGMGKTCRPWQRKGSLGDGLFPWVMSSREITMLSGLHITVIFASQIVYGHQFKKRKGLFWLMVHD